MDNLSEIDNFKIYNFIVILMALFIIKIIINYFYNIFIAKLSIQSSFDLIYDVIEHLKKLPLLYFNNINAAYLNQRINSDSSEIVSFVTNSFISFIISIFTCIISLYISFNINAKLTLALSVTIPLNIILYLKFKNKIYELSYDMKEVQNQFLSKVNEQLFNIRIIKVNSCFEFLASKLKKGFDLVFEKNINFTENYMLYNSFGTIISNVSTILLFLIGGLEIVKGKLSIGQFLAINFYFPMFSGSVQTFLSFASSYQSSLVCYNRTMEILNIKEENNGELELDNIHSLELKNLSFSYDSQKIFSNISFKFEKGKIYSLIGANGTGKTTLINLIIGLLGDYDGEIFYNSINIKHLNLYSVRKKCFGISEQEPVLFNDTILNNITYGSTIDSKDIEDYCCKLNVSNLIQKLPYKLETLITEKSTNLSGGEKQKISQLKAFVKNPNVIILDEPSSALDKESIILFKMHLESIKKEKIIIIVTHDNDMLDIADEFIDFNKSCAR